MSITIEIGARIRKLRVNKNFKQEDMATALELTPGAYAKIERGETDPSASRLFQIAKILKVDIMALLKDTPIQESSSKKESMITRAEWEQLSGHMNLLNKELEKIKSQLAGMNKPVSKKR